MELSKTAKRALAAYGGADRWRQAGAAEATVIVGGLLFRLKRRMPFPRARVRTEICTPTHGIGRRPEKTTTSTCGLVENLSVFGSATSTP